MIDRLCNGHKFRTERPRACNICNRLAIERDVVTVLVDTLLAQWYQLQVVNGEDEHKATRDRATVLEQLGEVDDEYIRVVKPAAHFVGWVRLVYGNSGYDVINDYTVNLEEVLRPVNAYADTMA